MFLPCLSDFISLWLWNLGLGGRLGSVGETSPFWHWELCCLVSMTDVLPRSSRLFWHHCSGGLGKVRRSWGERFSSLFFTRMKGDRRKALGQEPPQRSSVELIRSSKKKGKPGYSCPSPTPGACSNSCPLTQWCHPTISSSVIPFSSCLQSFPESVLEKTGKGVSSSHQVAKILKFQLQHQSYQWRFRTISLGWTRWIFCSPRDSQESSLIPQFKSINSSALSFLYSPTLTPIYDYWKNHSFDKMYLCQ